MKILDMIFENFRDQMKDIINVKIIEMIPIQILLLNIVNSLKLQI